jgi:hypothetical protein
VDMVCFCCYFTTLKLILQQSNAKCPIGKWLDPRY